MMLMHGGGVPLGAVRLGLCNYVDARKASYAHTLWHDRTQGLAEFLSYQEALACLLSLLPLPSDSLALVRGIKAQAL